MTRLKLSFHKPNALLLWRSFGTTPTAVTRPFEAIPKTTSLPLIGSMWEFLLPRTWNKPLYQLQFERMYKYGAIYRDSIPIMSEYVMVHRPEDVEEVFRKGEGRYPSRFSFLPWKKVREELGVGMGMLLQ